MKKEPKEKSGLKPIVNEQLKHDVRIVAKNGVEAKLWAREQGFKASQWKYAAQPEALAHVNDGFEVVFVPGWEERPDAGLFADAVAHTGAKVVAA
jgi:hypothetical protein